MRRSAKLRRLRNVLMFSFRRGSVFKSCHSVFSVLVELELYIIVAYLDENTDSIVTSSVPSSTMLSRYTFSREYFWAMSGRRTRLTNCNRSPPVIGCSSEMMRLPICKLKPSPILSVVENISHVWSEFLKACRLFAASFGFKANSELMFWSLVNVPITSVACSFRSAGKADSAAVMVRLYLDATTTLRPTTTGAVPSLVFL